MKTQTRAVAPTSPPAAREGELVPTRVKVVTFRSELDKMKSQLAQAMPEHLKVDRVLRIIMTEVQKTPKLLDCTRESLFGAILQCSQLGLEPGGVLGQAYLIPFENHKERRTECQLIVGYKGLIKLAYQSGEVGAVRARVVREKDEFSYGYGLHEHLSHIPYRGEDPGRSVAAYAVAKIKGIDEPQFVVLEGWEVAQIRARSKSPDIGPWATDPDEMAKKSALRRLCKLLPASVEKDNLLQRAVSIDEHAEVPGMSQTFDLTPLPPAEPGEESPEDDSLTKLAKSKTQVQAGPPPLDDPMPGWSEGAREPGAEG